MFLFIGCFFEFKCPVVYGSAYFQGLQKFTFHGLTRIESVLERFTHIHRYCVFIGYYRKEQE